MKKYQRVIYQHTWEFVMEGLEDQFNKFGKTWKLMILNIKVWMFQIRRARLHQLLANMNTFLMSWFEKRLYILCIEPMDKGIYFHFYCISFCLLSLIYIMQSSNTSIHTKINLNYPTLSQPQYSQFPSILPLLLPVSILSCLSL